MQKGKLEEKLEIAKKLIKQHIDFNIIFKATKLSIQEIEKLSKNNMNTRKNIKV